MLQRLACGAVSLHLNPKTNTAEIVILTYYLTSAISKKKKKKKKKKNTFIWWHERHLLKRISMSVVFILWLHNSSTSYFDCLSAVRNGLGNDWSFILNTCKWTAYLILHFKSQILFNLETIETTEILGGMECWTRLKFCSWEKNIGPLSRLLCTVQNFIKNLSRIFYSFDSTLCIHFRFEK